MFLVNIMYQTGELIFTGQNIGRFSLTKEEVVEFVLSLVNADIKTTDYTDFYKGFSVKKIGTGVLSIKYDNREFIVMDMDNLTDTGVLAGIIRRLT